jgi:hypothetical protein
MAGYGDDGGFADWAAVAGHTFPDADMESARQRGSDYIDAVYGSRFTGTPTGGIDQERAWPRTGAWAFGASLASNLIPKRVINAAYQAALMEMVKPGALTVITDPTKRVKRQKIDTIEREFFEPGETGSSSAPVSSVIEGLLAPLLVSEAGIGVCVV